MTPQAQALPPFSAAMLCVVQETAESVRQLTEGAEPSAWLDAGPLREQVTAQLKVLASAMRHLPPGLVRAMPELDWPGWRGLASLLRQPGPAHDDVMCFGVQRLVPGTLYWLKVYRTRQPDLFVYPV